MGNIEQGGLDIHNGEVIGYVVNSQCNYWRAVAFAEPLEGGFRVNRLGAIAQRAGESKK